MVLHLFCGVLFVGAKPLFAFVCVIFTVCVAGVSPGVSLHFLYLTLLCYFVRLVLVEIKKVEQTAFFLFSFVISTACSVFLR